MLPSGRSWRLLVPALLLAAAGLLGVHGVFAMPSAGAAPATHDSGHAAAVAAAFPVAGQAATATVGAEHGTARTGAGHATTRTGDAAAAACPHGCAPYGAAAMLACLAVLAALVRLAPRRVVPDPLRCNRDRVLRTAVRPLLPRGPQTPSLSMLCVART